MKKKKKSGWRTTGKVILHVVKTPYYIGKGIYKITKYTNKQVEEKKVKKTRKRIIPVYEEFEVLKSHQGEYSDWEENTFESDSRIGIILGARGTGKSAFGIKFLENFRAKKKKKCYAMGFNSKEMPSWIDVVESVEQLENDAVVLIDEGGILFSSRNAMSNANKLLSELILVARHKNLTILFISQNSSNLDINILRQADFLVLKPSSLLQKDFERKIIQKVYEKAQEDFENFKHIRGTTHIYSGDFTGFIANPLPSFWKVGISKGFG